MTRAGGVLIVLLTDAVRQWAWAGGRETQCTHR